MKGLLVWFTGRPSSGKSTLAKRVQAALSDRGTPSSLLDGDSVRAALRPRPGYTPQERDDFYASLTNLAALLAEQGQLVLVAATAHRREFRERARAAAPRFVEVYVDVPASEAERRDAKGLYAESERGAIHDLPGKDADYEPPLAPEAHVGGGLGEESLGAVMAVIEREWGASNE